MSILSWVLDDVPDTSRSSSAFHSDLFDLIDDSPDLSSLVLLFNPLMTSASKSLMIDPIIHCITNYLANDGFYELQNESFDVDSVLSSMYHDDGTPIVQLSLSSMHASMLG